MGMMTREIDSTYYLIYEMEYVFKFLKNRFHVKNTYYLDFINGRDDSLIEGINNFEVDEKRLDSEIRLLEQILSANPYMSNCTDRYLPELYKLKKQYQSLRKKAVKALEEYEKKIAEEKQSD